MVDTHYIVMVKASSISTSFWIPYNGLYTWDWRTIPPKRFTNKTNARNAIMADDLFKSGDWQIVKITHSEEVIENHEAEQL